MVTPLCDLTQIAFRLSGDTDVASVQNQPVMCVEAKRCRNVFLERLFDREYCFSGCNASSIGHTKYVGVDGNGWFSKRCVENDVCGFSADPG